MAAMLSSFTLGDTLDHTATSALYPPADGWVLKYRLVPRTTGTAIDITCTTVADGYRALVTAATTSAWTAGTYGWASWVELTGVKHSIAAGSIDLLADPRTASGALDMRAADQVALDAVRATLRGTASANVLSYEIAGRKLQHYSIAELLQLESKLATDVARSAAATAMASGQADTRKVYVRLARA